MTSEGYLQADGPTLAAYLRKIAGIPVSDADQHLARAIILEQAALLEQRTNLVLAARFAGSGEDADYLTSEVFSRLGMDLRLKMLDDLLGETLGEQWPFVLPVLKRVIELRNRFAHGSMYREGSRIKITSHNRGKSTQYEYETVELAWLVQQSIVVNRELGQIYLSLTPAEWFHEDEAE